MNKNMNRKAFTLVEMVVVIGILILLTMMTISLVNVTQDEDRVRAAAAQTQAFIEGARDRAFSSKENSGVRILYETDIGPNGETIAYGTSLVYIKASKLTEKDFPEEIKEPRIIISGQDISFVDPRVKLQWDNMVDRGLLPDTSKSGECADIFIGELRHTLYVSSSNGSYQYSLTRAPALRAAGQPVGYTILLNNIVMPNQTPMALPQNVVIDLTNSQLPDSWITGNTLKQNLDVMFSPSGIPIGMESAVGLLNLVVADSADFFQNKLPGQADKEGEERVVSVHMKTGGVRVAQVDKTDTNNNGKADDPFNYALLGR